MGEKWNYKAYIHPSTLEKSLEREFAKPQFAEVYGVQELKKNKFEIAAIRDVLYAAHLFLKKLGLESMNLSRDQIHILDPEKISEYFEPDAAGKTAFGNLYAQRNPNKMTFIHDLTHELSHFLSFYAINVTIAENSDERHININMRRMGYTFRKPQAGYEESDFSGLDEAMTELFAHNLRSAFVENSDLLAEADERKLENYYVYYPQILIIKKLIESAAENEEQSQEYFTELFREHVTGKYDLLKKIEQKHRGAVKVLRNMGTETQDALEAAKKLGFDNVVREIEMIKNENK